MSEIVDNLVSTIIPVYNRPRMLREAVRSVLAQTYRPIEIIISDDGSTDETADVSRELAETYPTEVRLVRNRNRGPGPAREAGRWIARGEFIQYLDSDDLLHPGKFAVQIAALRAHPECGVAYGRSRLIDAEGRVLADPFKWTGRQFAVLFPALLVDRWWCTHTPLYRRGVCDAVGPWSDLRWSQDWEYDGRIGALRTKLVHCDETVSDHRQHSGARQTGRPERLEPVRVRERKRFLGLMLRYAKQAGITPECPEMQHFSRWLFMVARWCGAAGLAEHSRECFEWAKEAAGLDRSRSADFRAYQAAAGVLGWAFVGKLSCHLDARLRHEAGFATMKQSWMAQ